MKTSRWEEFLRSLQFFSARVLDEINFSRHLQLNYLKFSSTCTRTGVISNARSLSLSRCLRNWSGNRTRTSTEIEIIFSAVSKVVANLNSVLCIHESSCLFTARLSRPPLWLRTCLQSELSVRNGILRLGNAPWTEICQLAVNGGKRDKAKSQV